MRHSQPAGDDQLRWNCAACGYVAYENPTLVVLVAVEAAGHLLLIRRATAPYKGCWAVPGGFVERGESVTVAAVRELWEEAGVRVGEDQLIPLFIASVVTTNQVYITFRAHLAEPVPLTPGVEASECGWFSRREFPRQEFWLPHLTDAVYDFYDCVESGRFRFYLSDWSETTMHNRAFDFDP